MRYLFEDGKPFIPDSFSIELQKLGSSSEKFEFQTSEGVLRSIKALSEPHSFRATIYLTDKRRKYSWEWENFEAEMQLLLPGRKLVEVPLDHPIFRAFYDISELVQVPNVYQGTTGGPTHEYDGFEPKAMGIFDDDGRLMVFVNWNTDLGDGWEWADHPQYPLKFSTYAYEMGINFIIYGMSN